MTAHRRSVVAGAALVVCLLRLPAPAIAAPDAQTRYSIANGCYALRAQSPGRLVANAEPFRMQATDLGRYLFYTRARTFLAADSEGQVGPASEPSERADWRVEEAGQGVFIVSLPAAGQALAIDPGSGELVLAANGERFRFEPAEGCAAYPEAEVNTVGQPLTSTPRYGEVRGLLDMHVLLMEYEALGGDYHCGRPWHRYGIAYALPDCADIYGPQASAAPVQVFVDSGAPVAPHDTRGWPTFHDWPEWNRTHYQQLYYKWLERAWRAGLRIFVADHNDNQVLCELMARRHTNCNEMDTVRRQIRDTYALQDYIDAQNGGPGKGWFRIVTDPFQARRVINDGKLAVVQGIETSALFDCTIYNDVPQCDRAQIERGLDEVYGLGVRQMLVTHIFDNAFGGVYATDRIRNTGNFIQTGRWWQIETCTGPEHESEQDLHAQDHMIGQALQAVLAPGTTPVYPPPPHCNARGLGPLGEYLIRRMMARGMIVDPDHMSIAARSQALALIGAHDYSGVISSHSWADEASYPEIYRLGGVITPYGCSAAEWRRLRRVRSTRFYFGFGCGTDIHGLGWTTGPPPVRGGSGESKPVDYPFKSFDGSVTLERQRSGERAFDINKDGVSHYGLFPDWIEALRIISDDQFVTDMSRGPEAYLQMWERAVGIPGPRCRYARGHFTRRGLSWTRLGFRPRDLLRRAGQPVRRRRAWRYCVSGRRNRTAKVVAVFTRRARVGLVASTGRGHEALGIAPGARARRLRGRARPFGRGVFVRRAGGGAGFVYGVRRGRVRYVGVASRSVARRPARLRRHLRIGGVR